GLSISTTIAEDSPARPSAAPPVRSAARRAMVLANFVTGHLNASPMREPWLYTQNPPRVGLQYLGPDFLADVEFGKIRQPAVRRDDRPVRAEQHLVLQNRIDVAHQDRRIICRRPAREVDIDVRLVGRDRQRLFLPREGGMREDDLEIRKI